MKIDKLLFLIFLCTVFFSCKKDGAFEQISYPSSYHKSGIKLASDLRVFSSTGEIRNGLIVSRFTEMDSAHYSYVADEIGNRRGMMDSIRFTDAQHAKVIAWTFPANCTIDKEGGNLILTQTDTTGGYSNWDEFTHSIAYHIGQLKPEVYSEYLISSVRGNYLFGYTARLKYVFQESLGQLAAPIILFTHHRDQGYNFGSQNNIFQNGFYKNIPVNDTVTVKTYFLLYEK